MNLNAFVQTLSFQEREKLLHILIEDSNNWTTQPPHIEWTTTTQPPKSKTTVSEDFVMHKASSLSNNKRREAVQAKTNQWSDEGEDRHIETPEIRKTPRTRKPPTKRQVRCHVCGKTESVNASLVYGEYYRCNSCLGNK